jgi:hypothetical protein
MSTVVNAKALGDVFTTLGYTNQNDLLAAALSSGIPAAAVLAYFSALAATPSGLNDQTISGVTPSQGTSITAFLKARGLVGT